MTEKCDATVYSSGSFRGHKCGRPVKYEDGKCGIHTRARKLPTIEVWKLSGLDVTDMPVKVTLYLRGKEVISDQDLALADRYDRETVESGLVAGEKGRFAFPASVICTDRERLIEASNEHLERRVLRKGVELEDARERLNEGRERDN